LVIVTSEQQALEKWITRFWCLLLLPWLIVAPLSGMAFDAGNNVVIYVFVWCVWTYPLVLGISVVLKRKRPTAAYLPALNLLLPFALAAILDAVKVIP
jgi:hypothetical protein